MEDNLRKLSAIALEKLFQQKKKKFEKAFASGQAYDEINSIYKALNSIQAEINRRASSKEEDDVNPIS
ncbi:MAG: hypothetical protein JWP88_1265 [Flaviaesturariibacter sp.]|nr:hypothetical protein [Flaviaesturariibacter sp.]